MLVFKAAQVLASSTLTLGKPWEMPDDRDPTKTRSGVSNYCDLTCIGTAGVVAVVRLKGKTEAEVVSKVKQYAIGKPAEIPILSMGETARGVYVLNG